MKRLFVVLLTFAALAPAANAWNSKGHMVVARIAWNQLKDAPAVRTKVVKLLEVHPHFDDFLSEGRPATIPEDEWVFLRAATWSDWVRSGPPERRKFHDGPAHYINLSFVLPKSKASAPKTPAGDILKKIAGSKAGIKNGAREKAAVDLCWLFHLVGDIHQPLHCVALFSEEFPKGDRGGNVALIKLDTRVVQLHKFWDALLGTSTTPSGINKTVAEIEKLVKDHPNAIKQDLAKNLTPESWAQESKDLAVRIAYVNGKLHPANTEDDPADHDIPRAPDDYAERAGETARYCAAKAGQRLAAELRQALDGK